MQSAGRFLQGHQVRANLFHLSLNPGNIILGLDGVQLRDFGLVPLLYQSGKDTLAKFNPGYAAPELGGGAQSSASDQYSLAAVYAALRSGRIAAKERAHGPVKKPTVCTIDLSQFATPERKVLIQALDQDPRRRFDSCSEFMQALDQTRGGTVSMSTSANALWATQEGFLRALCSWVQDKEKKCGGGYEVLADGTLQQTCAVQLVPGTATLWLCVFVQEWNVSVEHASEEAYVLFLQAPRSFWQKMSGKQMGIRIRLQFKLPEKNKAGLAELTTTLTPIGIGRRLMELFHKTSGPDILESVRKCLNAVPERRGAARFPLTIPIHVRHRASGQRPAEFECKTKDLSQTGIGLLSPAPMENGELRVVLRLPGADAQAPPIVLRANVKRCRPLDNGWYEIGASFLTDPNKKGQTPVAATAPGNQAASSA
ncbi:MAG: PilZ domain-containing protein [Gemmataceae bacterium]|nr:PilZ domain-containing protein [Gemmataceae bacterium]